MSIVDKYSKSLNEQWSMRFKTKHPDGDNYDGVVMQIKPQFIVLREERELEFDGVIILPKRFIKGYRDGKFERCQNEILRQNGAIKKLRMPRWLGSCENLSQVLAVMMKRDIWPGIEIIFDQGAKSAFYLGPIKRVAEEHFAIKGYDAAGKWEKLYELSYHEICRIEFDSKYCNHFNAYMKLSNGNT